MGGKTFTLLGSTHARTRPLEHRLQTMGGKTFTLLGSTHPRTRPLEHRLQTMGGKTFTLLGSTHARTRPLKHRLQTMGEEKHSHYLLYRYVISLPKNVTKYQQRIHFLYSVIGFLQLKVKLNGNKAPHPPPPQKGESLCK